MMSCYSISTDVLGFEPNILYLNETWELLRGDCEYTDSLGVMQYSPVDLYGISEENTASIFREEE